MLDLNDLRLDDALALLNHSAVPTTNGTQPTGAGYVQELIDRLCALSLRDPLTGLANRRHFRAMLERELDAVARVGRSALLLMVDIDHFKAINDRYGHQAGDQVLQAVAASLALNIRPMDTVARFGGEEFSVVLPNCDTTHGHSLAERLRQGVEALTIRVGPMTTVRATVSVGGVCAPVWVRSTTGLWIERADHQLYRAKSQGRNRVCIDQPQILSVSADERRLLFGHLADGDPAWLDRGATQSAGEPRPEVER